MTSLFLLILTQKGVDYLFIAHHEPSNDCTRFPLAGQLKSWFDFLHELRYNGVTQILRRYLMAAKKMTDFAIQTNLEDMSGWTVEDGKLHKQFHFESFVEAFGFMTSVALIAE